MTRYVSQPENLKTMMNMLRESSRNIQFEAFHVFKVICCFIDRICSLQIVTVHSVALYFEVTTTTAYGLLTGLFLEVLQIRLNFQKWTLFEVTAGTEFLKAGCLSCGQSNITALDGSSCLIMSSLPTAGSKDIMYVINPSVVHLPSVINYSV